MTVAVCRCLLVDNISNSNTFQAQGNCKEPSLVEPLNISYFHLFSISCELHALRQRSALGLGIGISVCREAVSRHFLPRKVEPFLGLIQFDATKIPIANVEDGINMTLRVLTETFLRPYTCVCRAAFSRKLTSTRRSEPLAYS